MVEAGILPANHTDLAREGQNITRTTTLRARTVDANTRLDTRASVGLLCLV